MNNIIPDVENQDDIQTINEINLKVLHDNETYKLKMNNNVLIWKNKTILQIHLNITLSIIELLYNNTELLDDKTVLSYKIGNNIQVKGKYDEWK